MPLIPAFSGSTTLLMQNLLYALQVNPVARSRQLSKMTTLLCHLAKTSIFTALQLEMPFEGSILIAADRVSKTPTTKNTSEIVRILLLKFYSIRPC